MSPSHFKRVSAIRSQPFFFSEGGGRQCLPQQELQESGGGGGKKKKEQRSRRWLPSPAAVRQSAAGLLYSCLQVNITSAGDSGLAQLDPLPSLRETFHLPKPAAVQGLRLMSLVPARSSEKGGWPHRSLRCKTFFFFFCSAAGVLDALQSPPLLEEETRAASRSGRGSRSGRRKALRQVQLLCSQTSPGLRSLNGLRPAWGT